jgi:signal transduction histidine kinase
MNSLKGRLIAVATIWVLVGVFLSALVLSRVFTSQITQQFNDELREDLDELENLAGTSPSAADPPRPLSDARYEIPGSGYYWEIRRGDDVVSRSKSLQQQTLAAPPYDPAQGADLLHSISGPTGPLLLAEKIDRGIGDAAPIRYFIAIDTRFLDQAREGFRETLAWSMGAFAFSMILAASILILIALRPLEILRGALIKVRNGSKKSVEGRFPQEVQPLVDDLNAMLVSTTELLSRSRAQAGNLAHGLKTPLAILMDEAHGIESKGLPESAEIIIDQCRRMQRHIDYELTRARAVAMRSIPGTVASVSKAAADVTSALSRLYQSSGAKIENKVLQPLTVVCDAEDLNEILANLVDNACKHSKERVVVSASQPHSAATVRISVDDDGPGLPPEAYEVVFNVGERWDSKAPGAGLGLSIVRDLVQLYGGTIRLGSSPLGGLQVELDLPAAC